MAIEWPPSDWQESDLYRDSETRLPTQIYPFRMSNLDDQGGRLPYWTVIFEGEKSDKIIHNKIDCTWAAYRAMLDAYEAWFPARPVERVYFIGTALKPGEMVKIGYSLNPQARLNTLQTGHHTRLRILATTPGGRDLELKYHNRWRTRRKRGEWFQLGDCIINEINRINGKAA